MPSQHHAVMDPESSGNTGAVCFRPVHDLPRCLDRQRRAVRSVDQTSPIHSLHNHHMQHLQGCPHPYHLSIQPTNYALLP